MRLVETQSVMKNTINIVGQDYLLQKLGAYDLSTLPHAFILEGEEGSGRHSLLNFLSQNLNLQIAEVDSREDLYDTVCALQESAIPQLLCFSAATLTEKCQHALLKVIEEPPAHIFIAIIVQSARQLLETVVNRCTIFTLARYPKEILQQFTEDGVVLSLATTPGQIKQLQQYNVKAAQQLSNAILTKAAGVAASALLQLSNKVSFNEQEEGLPLTLLARALQQESLNLYRQYKQPALVEASSLISQLLVDLTKSGNKQRLFEHFLFNLKAILVPLST